MFQFSALASISDISITDGLSHSDTRGSIGYVRLIPNFRSLSRPSSPPGAKASPARPSLLFFNLFQIKSTKNFASFLLLYSFFVCFSVYTFSNIYFDSLYLLFIVFQFVNERMFKCLIYDTKSISKV